MNSGSANEMTENCPIARWRRKKEARPSEILDAALAQFVEKGFRATKMEDIARAAGVTKGTPYLYFQNKEDILKAVVRETLVANLKDIQLLAGQHAGSTAVLLHLMVETWWHKVGSAPSAGLCKLMIAEASNFPELAQFYFDEVIQPSTEMMALILQRGIDQGEFRPLPVAHAVDALMAPLISTMIMNHSFGQLPGCPLASTHNPLAYLKDALDLVLSGILKK